MKPLIIRIILSVTGFIVPVDELETRLSVIAPVDVQVIDLTTQSVSSFAKRKYDIATIAAKGGVNLYVTGPFVGLQGEDLFAGYCSYKHQVGFAAVIPGRDHENLQLLLHELGHCVANMRHTEGCSVMSAVPCSLEFLERDVLRARRFLRRKIR